MNEREFSRTVVDECELLPSDRACPAPRPMLAMCKGGHRMLQIPLADLDVTGGCVYQWGLAAPEEFEPDRPATMIAAYYQDRQFVAAVGAQPQHEREQYWGATTIRNDRHLDIGKF